MSLNDPKERRETPLGKALQARIRASGPISVADYMRSCLYDPEHGYYRVRSAIGQDGDFITAPEISQIFGELIGLWSVVVWQQMGAPGRVRLIEIGPGRGTLLLDALRAAGTVQAFAEALRVTLVESSEVLVEQQRTTLADVAASAQWFTSLDQVEAGVPTILIANEFLDTRIVEQIIMTDNGHRRRAVGLDGSGSLVLTELDDLTPADVERLQCVHPSMAPGDIAEHQDSSALIAALVRLAAAAPLAALFIDYGHPSVTLGDTLQAVRGHRFEHPLASPGEADLCVQVDFATFAKEIPGRNGTASLVVDGPVTQAEFLGELGIIERAARLMADNPDAANAIESGVARLMAPLGMGGRFKAIAIRSPALPQTPGFAPRHPVPAPPDPGPSLP